MPIPSSQIIVAEIIVTGRALAGGSTSHDFQLVTHWRRTAVVNPVIKSRVDTAFQAAIAVPYAALLNARYTQSFNTLRWVNDALDSPVPIAHALPGLVAGDSMTMEDTAYLLLRTGLRGKSYRGCKFLGPLSEADTTGPSGDVFNAAALARLATFATALFTGFIDADLNTWVPCILSRKLSTLQTNPTVVVTNDVSQVLVNQRCSTLNRRKVPSVY